MAGIAENHSLNLLVARWVDSVSAVLGPSPPSEGPQVQPGRLFGTAPLRALCRHWGTSLGGQMLLGRGVLGSLVSSEVPQFTFIEVTMLPSKVNVGAKET